MSGTDRYARLPKWAQREILELKKRVEECASNFPFTEPTNTYMLISNPPQTMRRVPLPKGVLVEFVLSSQQSIEVRGKPGRIEVFGKDTLCVAPYTSACVGISLWKGFES